MIVFQEMNLPIDFTQLLRSNAGQMDERNMKMSDVVNSRRELRKFLDHYYFDNVHVAQKAEVFLKTVSWNNLRNLLASLYLYKSIYKNFPHTPSIYEVKELLDFEQTLFPHAVDGFSRSFLLAFYFKMLELNYPKRDFVSPLKNRNLNATIIQILKKQTSKIIHIDWVYLVLTHFVLILGPIKALEMITEQRLSYGAIYAALSQSEKKIMTANLLAYSCSVNDQDLILPFSLGI